MPTTIHPTPRLLALVLVGGVVGSIVRQAMTGSHDGVPLGMLAVNLVGAAIAGFAVGQMRRHSHRARLVIPLVVVGMAGAMTTFSGMIVETLLLLDAGHMGDAGVFLGLSTVLGPLVAACGLWAGRR